MVDSLVLANLLPSGLVESLFLQPHAIVSENLFAPEQALFDAWQRKEESSLLDLTE